MQRVSSKPSLLNLVFRHNYHTCYGLLARGSDLSNPYSISLYFAILRRKTSQPENPCLEPIGMDFFIRFNFSLYYRPCVLWATGRQRLITIFLPFTYLLLRFAIFGRQTPQPENPCLEPIATDFF